MEGSLLQFQGNSLSQITAAITFLRTVRKTRTQRDSFPDELERSNIKQRVENIIFVKIRIHRETAFTARATYVENFLSQIATFSQLFQCMFKCNPGKTNDKFIAS